MSVFILIHGAWHGAWCWEKVIPLLHQAGHMVYAPDLPSHGKDKTSCKDIHLHNYINFIGKIIKSIPEKVILVGHSMAGLIITQLTDRFFEHIEKLIYIAAFLPEDGESLFDINKKFAVPQQLFKVNINEADNLISLDSELELSEIFYNHCNKIDSIKAITLIKPEPFHPFIERVKFNKGKFTKLTKVYLECLLDNAISLEMQRAMYARTNCKPITLNTGHSPFYSMPIELAMHLIDMA
jgi:pimeloyl-ACP methyl ester carboxylesterase